MLIKGEGDDTVGDLLNVVNPRTDIGFHGRRGQFDVSYDGAFLLYHDLSIAEQLRPARGGIRASSHLAPRDAVCPQQFRARADDPVGGARRRAVPPHWLDHR